MSPKERDTANSLSADLAAARLTAKELDRVRGGEPLWEDRVKALEEVLEKEFALIPKDSRDRIRALDASIEARRRAEEGLG